MTSIHLLALILPSTTIKVPTPSQFMQTQIIELARQPRTPRPGFKHGGVNFSPGRRQISTRLSIPHIPYIHHNKSPSARNHLHFCAYSIYTMPAVFSKSDAYFYNTLVIFCFLQFFLNSLIRLIESKSSFLEWTFSVRFYNPIKFSSVTRCQQRLPTRSLLVFRSSTFQVNTFILYKKRDNSNLITENFATKHRQRIQERNDVMKFIFTFDNVL